MHRIFHFVSSAPVDARHVRVEIFSGTNCHLCDVAKAVLENLRVDLQFQLQEVQIGSDPELYERYRLEIPVVHIDGRKAFKFRVDPAEARLRIERAAMKHRKMETHSQEIKESG